MARVCGGPAMPTMRSRRFGWQRHGSCPKHRRQPKPKAGTRRETPDGFNPTTALGGSRQLKAVIGLLNEELKARGIKTSHGRALRAAAGYRLPLRARKFAEDERDGAVRLTDSTAEVGEQGGGRRGGADGGKRWDQKECGTAKHGPDTEPGSRVTSAGSHTRGRYQEQEGTPHGAPAPCRHRLPALGLLQLEEARSARRRRGDMGPIRGEPRGQPRRSPRTGQRRDVSSVAITPEVHTEGRWQATAARHRSNRGQDCPGGGGGDPHADLRGGVPGVQLWVPTRARPARCAGRARVWDQGTQDQLDSRCRHPILL